MATQLFLRSAITNAIGGTFRDTGISRTPGSAVAYSTNTTSGGTNIQLTAANAGAVLEWITAPSSMTWTLSGTVTFNFWARESSTATNATLRARLYKRTSGGTVTEILPSNSATTGYQLSTSTEMSTTIAARTWTGTPTSTSFAVGDRLIIRFFAMNIGTMGAVTGTSGATTGGGVYGTYDGPTAGASGDCYVTLTENTSFIESTFVRQENSVSVANNAITSLSLPNVLAGSVLAVVAVYFESGNNDGVPDNMSCSPALTFTRQSGNISTTGDGAGVIRTTVYLAKTTASGTHTISMSNTGQWAVWSLMELTGVDAIFGTVGHSSYSTSTGVFTVPITTAAAIGAPNSIALSVFIGTNTTNPTPSTFAISPAAGWETLSREWDYLTYIAASIEVKRITSNVAQSNTYSVNDTGGNAAPGPLWAASIFEITPAIAGPARRIMLVQ